MACHHLAPYPFCTGGCNWYPRAVGWEESAPWVVEQWPPKEETDDDDG